MNIKILLLFFFCFINFKSISAEVKILNDVAGDGTEVINHSIVYVHYIGLLEDNTEFDNSYKRGEPINFQIGTRKVISGWELGIIGMKKGGKRKIFIPSQLAYGENAIGDVIPANSNLIFELEIIDVVPPKYKLIDSLQLKLAQTSDFKIVDIRTDIQRKKTGIIPGSILITAFDETGNFIKDFFRIYQENITNGDKVIFVSDRGEISAILANGFAENLQQLNIYSLKDGINGLINNDFKLEEYS